MMRSNAKNLAIAVLLGVLFVGMTEIASAQEILPKGGDSFENAVEIQPGNYEGHSLESKEVEYFYIKDIGPRQELDIKGTFVAASTNAGAEAVLDLYGEDKAKLAEEIDSGYTEPIQLTISWPQTGEDSNKYYLKLGSGLFKIASFSLEVSLKEAPAEEEEEEVEEAAPVVLDEPAEGTPAEGLNWTLILGVIVIIVIVGIVIYLVLKKKE
jgi:hypothetical protein